MTNTEIIQAIRNEIERLKTVQLKRIQEGDLVDAEPYDKNEAYNELLSFLETLESGKPMQEELEEEIAGMYQALFGTDVINRKEMIYLDTFEAIARHFVQWQKEQMMKEAVEGEVCIPNVWVEHKEGKELVVRAEISKELGFKFGDKVRVVVCKKEDLL